MIERLSRRVSTKTYIESTELRLLPDSTGEAIYGIDMMGNCTIGNSACLRLLGYSDPVELIGKHMHKIMHHTRPDGTPYPSDECRIYLAFRGGEGSHVDDEVVWRADGTSFPVEYWSYPIRDENVLIGAVVTFVDITERKRAEHALQQSAEMFRQLMENIREVFFIVEPDPPTMVYVSPAYEEVAGRPRLELYDRDDAWIDSVYPQLAADCRYCRRHDRPQANTGRDGSGQGSRRSSKPGEKRAPRQHESRNPNTYERHYWNDRPPARHGVDPRTGR